MSSEYDPVKMCSECQPVKETTQHPNCKAVPLSNTVFIDLPVTTSVTVFVKLPAFASNLVYEDTSNTLEHQDPPSRPQVNGSPRVPPSDVDHKVHITQGDLKKYRKTCSDFEKNVTLSAEELREFVSKMIELIMQMAVQYPAIFSVKPDHVLKPGLEVQQLTRGDLENHQERWEDILQTSDVIKIKEHMLETMQKLENVVLQTEYYREEMETLQENVRQIEVINEQKESLDYYLRNYS